MRILEHCCYRKYLSEWWSSRKKPDDTWTLINYGDHVITELIDWAVMTLYSKDREVSVSLVMPVVTDETRKYLSEHKFIKHITILTRQEIHDLHVQAVTITNGTDAIVISGTLLQAVSPGKYVHTVNIGMEHYKSIQPLIDSWKRLYK